MLLPLTVVLGDEQSVKFRIAAAIFPPVGSTIEVPNGNLARVLKVRVCHGEEGFYVAIDVEFVPLDKRAARKRRGLDLAAAS